VRGMPVAEQVTQLVAGFWVDVRDTGRPSTMSCLSNEISYLFVLQFLFCFDV
jgi:hypothetical protein